MGKAPAASKAPAEAKSAAPQPAGDAGRSRDNPATATFVGRYRLNKDGSEKQTWHLDFDLSAAKLDYVVGDAFGLFPKNDPALADAVIAALGVSPDYEIGGEPCAIS